MIYHTAHSTLTWLPEGIVEQTYSEGSTVDLEEARRILELIHEMVGDGPLFLLNDLRSKTVFTRDARSHFAQNSGIVGAAAFMINSKVGEVTVNFFLRFNIPDYDLRIFSEREEAIAWLVECRADAGGASPGW